MRILRTLLLGLFLAFIVTFSLKNAGYVQIRYFSMIDDFEIPLFLLTLLSLSLGIFGGAIIDLIFRQQLRRAIRRQQKLMDQLQMEHRSLVIKHSEDSTTWP
jgi:uncharacterized integral membrane protein